MTALPGTHPIHARVDDLFATHEQRRNTVMFLAGLRINTPPDCDDFDVLIDTYLRRAAPCLSGEDLEWWFSRLIAAVQIRQAAFDLASKDEAQEDEAQEDEAQKACARVDDALAHLCGEATQ